jgi:hypothetical protein
MHLTNAWTGITSGIFPLNWRRLVFPRSTFSSRHIRDAVNSLSIPTLDLTCPKMNDDIKTFVVEQLDDPQFARVSVDGKELVTRPTGHIYKLQDRYIYTSSFMSSHGQ